MSKLDKDRANTVTLKIDQRGVATVTLSRAAKHNAFDAEMIAAMLGIFQRCAQDRSLRAVLLQAEGGNFSAGADLAWMKSAANNSYAANLQDAEQLSLLMQSLAAIPCPTVARVQGSAFGGALGLICACDIAIAAESAKFSLSEVKLGLIPAVISPYVIDAIGKRQAQRYMLTAELFNANRAKDLGVVHEVVDSSELDATCQQVITQLLNNGPQALICAKRLINIVASQERAMVIPKTVATIAEIRTSAEGQEGLSAFLEKRKPNWSHEV